MGINDSKEFRGLCSCEMEGLDVSDVADARESGLLRREPASPEPILRRAKRSLRASAPDAAVGAGAKGGVAPDAGLSWSGRSADWPLL